MIGLELGFGLRLGCTYINIGVHFMKTFTGLWIRIMGLGLWG